MHGEHMVEYIELEAMTTEEVCNLLETNKILTKGGFSIL